MDNRFLLLLLATVIIISTWLTNNISTRLDVLEDSMAKTQIADLSELNKLINDLNDKVLFNNNMIREIYGILERQDESLRDVEDNLATWMEKELGKIHLRLDSLPMGN